jgi:hypothetical protein
MNDTTVKPERRIEAMRLIESLLRHNEIITPDIVYETLAENGFNEDERMRLSGAILRTANANGWSERTCFSVRSTRNSSNSGSLWASLIYARKASGKTIAATVLEKENAKWTARGLIQPQHSMHLTMWRVARESQKSNSNIVIRELNKEEDGVDGNGICVWDTKAKNVSLKV